MIQYDCHFMGKSAYAQCGQAASVGVPVGCVRINKLWQCCTSLALCGTALRNVRKVYLYDKEDDKTWTKRLSVDGYVGQNGITNNKKEGDRKTPSGIYGFDIAFGLAENPGTNIIYKQINKNDYWVDDPNSKYYNKWVDIMEVDKDFKSAEHLYDHKIAYKYGLVINYNTENIIKGKGSAIFFHVSTNGPTHGCVSVDEDTMVKILKILKPYAKIIIAKDRYSISELFK